MATRPPPECEDGIRFRGRGFIQLTGRYNYTQMQQQIADKVKVDIVDNPDDAGKPEVAAKIFAAFLAKHRSEIEKHMEGKDYRNARKVVNNAALGLDVFSKAIDDFEKKFLQPPAPSEHLNILQPPPPVPAP